MVRFLWRWARRAFLTLLLLVIVLAAPSVYVETSCRGTPAAEPYNPILVNPAWQRSEAASYFSYPEWHVAYTQQGLAHVLDAGADESAFDYVDAVFGFWQSACALNRAAENDSAAPLPLEARIPVYVTGASFTLGMGMKALYEQTIGRAIAALRGPEKTPQDRFAAQMTADYTRFLERSNWYSYDFAKAIRGLWSEPLTEKLRGWERRIALTGEWSAKAAYARAYASTLASREAPQSRIRTVVRNLPPAQLAAIPNVEIAGAGYQWVLIETPRGQQYARLLGILAAMGGEIAEIAGNDAVLVSVLSSEKRLSLPGGSKLITTIPRAGFGGYRHLVDVRTGSLSQLLRSLAQGEPKLERVYDY